ncbi:hypothetical protein P343_08585 [Sporolactobacillus laevolacticus DSM 442]|uniref:Uncharacterized protein n=1 Tax=Sporolactobacillus laevolacticus DSM 442 TaxID=1395513 RepID=V6IXV4_9BACL|nr:hypothetical protein P343_08585 [Sporolactobacillus laevolacticus DSM 442]
MPVDKVKVIKLNNKYIRMNDKISKRMDELKVEYAEGI